MFLRQSITKHSAIVYKQPELLCVTVHTPQFRLAKFIGSSKSVQAFESLGCGPRTY